MQRYTFQRITVQLIVFCLCLIRGTIHSQILTKSDFTVLTAVNVKVGAEHTDEYLALLQGKNVAVVANQTSLIKSKPLTDTLRSLGVKVVKIFAPEHGFFGEQDAGDTVKNSHIPSSSIHIISLYGKHNK